MTGVLGWPAYVGWLAYVRWWAVDPVDPVDPDDVRPGYGALLLVLTLAVVTYLLWRSMNTQLGKIQMPPRQPPREPPSDTAGSSDVEEVDDDAERPPAPPGN